MYSVEIQNWEKRLSSFQIDPFFYTPIVCIVFPPYVNGGWASSG